MSALAPPLDQHLFSLLRRTPTAGVDAEHLRRGQLAQSLREPARQRLVEELAALTVQGSVALWFGHDASPPRRESVEAATRFLMLLPARFLDLEISPELDRGITFDWYRSDDRQLSITLDARGQLFYAAMLGPIERMSGRLAFADALPDEIARILLRIAK